MTNYNYVFHCDADKPMPKHLVIHDLCIPLHKTLDELTSAHGNPLSVDYCPHARSIAFIDRTTKTGVAFKTSDANKLIAAINEATRMEDEENA